MKEFLEKIIAARTAKAEELRAAIKASEDANEVRALGDTLEAVLAELQEAKDQLDEIDEPADDDQGAGADEGARKMNVLGTMQSRAAAPKANDPLDTVEYRNAFMEFCKRGTPIPAELRGDATTTTTDASAAIPTTLVNEIVKELKVYGNLYAAVRKLNVQGGVNIPILTLKPTATWITADTATSESDKQKIKADTAVSFSYYGLECKVAQTLLVNVTTIDAFQALFAELAVEAIAKAMDIAIIKGSGSGEPTGVTADARVTNVVTLSAADIASWAQWKKKVFAKIPKAYRNGNFYMAQGTFDGYIDGMVDDAGQPIARVNYGIADGEVYRFGGKAVETVEDDVIASYDDASSGDVIAVFFNPTDYVINSNLEMQAVKWVDNDTNEIKNKVILIADGKLVDPNGVVVVKKA